MAHWVHDHLSFWASIVQTDRCWLWLGASLKRGPHGGGGYGRIHWDGRQRLAHQVAYEIFCGPITPGLVVMHTCDVPLCVRPDHLRLGTSRANRLDCVAKGRTNYTRGPTHAQAVREGIAHARALRALGATARAEMGPTHINSRE